MRQDEGELNESAGKSKKNKNKKPHDIYENRRKSLRNHETKCNFISFYWIILDYGDIFGIF